MSDGSGYFEKLDGKLWFLPQVQAVPADFTRNQFSEGFSQGVHGESMWSWRNLGGSIGGVDHQVQPGRACSCVDLDLVMFGHLRKLDCSSIQGCSQHI